ncbi:MAG: J domain-containing protein [Pseudomonadota bacterium]
MKPADAANILGLTGKVDPQIVKIAYRKAAKTYHPDQNPAGAEMMKVINAAYDVLKGHIGEIEQEEPENAGYPEALNEALNSIVGLSGLEIEICGAWVWVGGNTKAHKDVLKESSFKWASKKKRWYLRPENWRSASRGKFSMEDIRDKYGSSKPHSGRSLIEGHE